MKKLKLKRIKKSHTTLLIDFKALIYRSRYTSGTQLSFNEVNTTINYLTLATMLSVAKKFNTTKCVICADLRDGSIRREEYPGYKVKKYTKPLSAYDIKLNSVFQDEYEKILVEFHALGLYPNSLSRYEADDLIAQYCLEYGDKENIIILTIDEDMYQCLSKNISIYNLDKKVRKTDKWFRKEYGIEPKDWATVKSLSGCNSDCVSGVAGIGEKTALAYILGNATPNQIKKINSNSDLVKQCLQVVTLPHPTFKLKKPFKQTKLNKDKFIIYCQKLGLRKHLDSLHEFIQFFG